jgi:imidazolonepropionase-like amidohydrolase
MKARDGTAADQADLIVRNAKITTLQSNGSVAETLAVRAEKFVAVGGQTELKRLADDGTRVVDAGGRRVIPGLNDSHMHAPHGVPPPGRGRDRCRRTAAAVSRGRARGLPHVLVCAADGQADEVT